MKKEVRVVRKFTESFTESEYGPYRYDVEKCIKRSFFLFKVWERVTSTFDKEYAISKANEIYLSLDEPKPKLDKKPKVIWQKPESKCMQETVKTGVSMTGY